MFLPNSSAISTQRNVPQQVFKNNNSSQSSVSSSQSRISTLALMDQYQQHSSQLQYQQQRKPNKNIKQRQQLQQQSEQHQHISQSLHQQQTIHQGNLTKEQIEQQQLQDYLHELKYKVAQPKQQTTDQCNFKNDIDEGYDFNDQYLPHFSHVSKQHTRTLSLQDLQTQQNIYNRIDTEGQPPALPPRSSSGFTLEDLADIQQQQQQYQQQTKQQQFQPQESDDQCQQQQHWWCPQKDRQTDQVYASFEQLVGLKEQQNNNEQLQKEEYFTLEIKYKDMQDQLRRSKDVVKKALSLLDQQKENDKNNYQDQVEDEADKENDERRVQGYHVNQCTSDYQGRQQQISQKLQSQEQGSQQSTATELRGGRGIGGASLTVSVSASASQSLDQLKNSSLLRIQEFAKPKQPSEKQKRNQQNNHSQNLSGIHTTTSLSQQESEIQQADMVIQSQYEERYLRRLKPLDQLAEKENQFYVQRRQSLDKKIQETMNAGGSQQKWDNKNQVRTKKEEEQIVVEEQLQLTIERLMVELRMSKKLVAFLESQNAFFLNKLAKIEENCRLKYKDEQERLLQEHQQEMEGLLKELNESKECNETAQQQIEQLMKIQGQLQEQIKQQGQNMIELEQKQNKCENCEKLQENLQMQKVKMIRENACLREELKRKEAKYLDDKRDFSNEKNRLLEEIERLEIANITVREEFAGQINAIKNANAEDFRMLDSKVRDTILKKDECIGKLNTVIQQILQKQQEQQIELEGQQKQQQMQQYQNILYLQKQQFK